MSYGIAVERLLGDMRRAGISKAAAQRVVPQWWKPDTEQYDDAVTELKLRFARTFGLDVEALVDRDTVQFEAPGKVRFKRARVRAELEKLNPFVAYTGSLARTTAASMVGFDTHKLPTNPLHARAAILKAHPTLKWVSLESLIDFCWGMGVGVIHVANPPFETKGFDGLSLVVEGRPVIVLARTERMPAWQSFILAHELAHIALKHVGDNEVIVDESIMSNDEQADAPSEPEELAADEYALKLLGGDSAGEVLDFKKLYPMDRFIDTAVQRGLDTKTDPGHLILRSAHVTRQWGPARVALAELQKHKDEDAAGRYSAIDVINGYVLEALKLESVADDTRNAMLDALGVGEKRTDPA